MSRLNSLFPSQAITLLLLLLLFLLLLLLILLLPIFFLPSSSLSLSILATCVCCVSRMYVSPKSKSPHPLHVVDEYSSSISLSFFHWLLRWKSPPTQNSFPLFFTSKPIIQLLKYKQLDFDPIQLVLT